jgi:hypothetical protein
LASTTLLKMAEGSCRVTVIRSSLNVPIAHAFCYHPMPGRA